MTKLGFEIVAETLNGQQATLLGNLCAKSAAAKLMTACKKAGCPWDEALAIADMNLISVEHRSNRRKATVVVTELGRLVSNASVARG